MPKKISERAEAWMRILIAIVSGVILSIWRILIFVLAVVNWFITVFSGKRSKELADFSEYLNTETYKYMRYLTFVSNKRPFPFSDLERMSKFEKR